MTGEICVGRLINGGQLVIGEPTKDGGLQNMFIIALVQDPQNQQRIAVQMKSPFWPISDKGGEIGKDLIMTMVEITEADLISEYIKTKNGSSLSLVTGGDAKQVMNQLNQQMKNAQNKGIIKG